MSKLYVGATNDFNCLNDIVGILLQTLLQLFTDGQHWCGTEAITGMHTHGIDVFDEANSYHLVLAVPHDFELKLFPSENRFFDQDLAHYARAHAALCQRLELFHVVRKTAARAAHRIRRPDHARKTDLFDGLLRLVIAIRNNTLRHLDAKRVHRVFERLPVLASLDGIQLHADHLHAVLVEHSCLRQLGAKVEARLATQIRQKCIRPFLLDDLRHLFQCESFHVCCVGCAGIGHDRGRIRVRQHNLVAERAKRLARLRS